MTYFAEFYALGLRMTETHHVGTRALRATAAPDAETEAKQLLRACHPDEVALVRLYAQPARENYSLIGTFYRA